MQTIPKQPPLQCEICGKTIPTNDHGAPMYKSLITLRDGGRPPVSIRVCRECWHTAMHPQHAQGRQMELIPPAGPAREKEIA